MTKRIIRNDAGEITAQNHGDGEHEEFLTQEELIEAGMIEDPTLPSADTSRSLGKKGIRAARTTYRPTKRQHRQYID